MTVCALLLGREGSQGFPGKNTHPVLGRPLLAYPLLAAKNAKVVDRIYISTDSQKLKEIGVLHGARGIDRPPHLGTAQALGDDAFAHGYGVIREELAREGKTVELLALLFANAATLTARTIEEGVEVLRKNPSFDSVVTVSRYNMWSPLRARRITGEGILQPFVPFETFGDPKTLNCDRDSQGDVWFADMSLSVVRPGCMENLKGGLLPQRWMGRRIAPLEQWGGLDVDYEWQVPQVEYWLRKHGFSETRTPYDP